MQGTTEEKDSWLYQHFTRDIPKHEIDYEEFDIAGSTNNDQSQKGQN